MSYRDRDEPLEPLPKPYGFVPLPDGGMQTRAPAGHHQYRADSYTGVLRATIIVHSLLHIGSGLLEPTADPRYPLVKGHFRTGGVLAIPGTSLKGCIRSIVEAISRSSVQITRARPLPQDVQPSRSVDRLDVAQRIFGALGYQGLVRFGDARLEDGQAEVVPSVQLFRPRSEAVDTYYDGRQPRGRKFYMHGTPATGNLPLEACAIGSRFGVQMAFENLSPGELGLVLIALGLGEPRLYPKLGGGKPACLGTIEVTEPQVMAFAGTAAYANFDAQAELLAIVPLLDAARRERLVLDEQLSQLAEILRWPRADRACPDREY